MAWDHHEQLCNSCNSWSVNYKETKDNLKPPLIKKKKNTETDSCYCAEVLFPCFTKANLTADANYKAGAERSF